MSHDYWGLEAFAEAEERDRDDAEIVRQYECSGVRECERCGLHETACECGR